MFNFDALRRSDNIAVHCPDRDVAIAFVREFRELFPGGYFRGYPGDSEYWDENREQTCYEPRMASGPKIFYGYVDRYKERGFEIINVMDIMMCDLGKFAPSEVNIECLFGME